MSKFTQQEGFKKVAHAIRNSEVQAKTNVFSQLTLPSNSLVLTSHLSNICLELRSSWLSGGSAENIEEKKKIDRRKSLKSEEKEKRRIRGKLNTNKLHLWF